MEIETVNNTLRELGFDEKEIAIYLALLRIGETTATKISQETNIERTLVYYIIEKLMNQGLVSYKFKNNVKYYSAANPEKILDDLKEKEKSFQGVLPFLLELQKKQYHEPVKVEIYKGQEGLKALINDMFKQKTEFLIFGEEGQIQTHSPTLYKQYLRRLIEEDIHEKLIVRGDWRGKIWKSKNSHLRYISKDVISPVTTVIYANKVFFSIWDPPYYHVLIQSKNLTDSFKAYFNHFWKIAKK